MTQPTHILHLEDDANDAELLALHLSAEKYDCDIVWVKTDKEFSQALDNGHFDVILADNSGPFFSGQDALAMARKKLPKAPFIFVTGSAHGDSAVAAMKTGSDGYVVKHRLSELVPTIQHALETKKK